MKQFCLKTTGLDHTSSIARVILLNEGSWSARFHSQFRFLKSMTFPATGTPPPLLLDGGSLTVASPGHAALCALCCQV